MPISHFGAWCRTTKHDSHHLILGGSPVCKSATMERWEMGWVQIKEMDHDTAKRCTRCKHVAQEQERRREEIRLKRVEAGRKGGQASTPMKRLTARLNGLLGTPSKCLGGVC